MMRDLETIEYPKTAKRVQVQTRSLTVTNGVTKRKTRTWNVGFVACMVAVSLLATGCSKQRAEMSLKTATGNIEQAKKWNADKFDESKAALKAAEDAAKAAQQSLDSDQGSQALTSAQDAKKQSTDAVENAKSRFAALQVDNGRKSLEVARINNGESENANLFTDAQKALAEAEEYNGKQKYEDAILSGEKAQTLVDQLLASLKNNAENRLEQLLKKKEELERQDAANFLPNAIIQAQQSIDQITKKIKTDRDYRQAIILANTAVSQAEGGIVETKKRKSNLDLQTIESKISEAISEDAPIYAPEQLKNAQESFEELLKNYYEQQYDTVLASATDLKPRVDQLITITRIESTKDKIKQVGDGIRRLQDQDVEVYLTGRIKAMIDLRAEAEGEFNNNNYDAAKEAANRALVEQDRIVTQFDALADKNLTDANQALNTATRTFRRMTELFGSSRDPKGIDGRLDAQRAAETAQMGTTLENATANLASSNQNRSGRQFKKAIEQAKDVQGASDQVLNGTYRVVASHAVLSIQDELSELSRQGATARASNELTQVQFLVEQTQKLITENQNRQAAESAAKSRAYLDNVKQALARRAAEDRERAERLVQRLEGSRPQRLVLTGESPGGGGSNKEWLDAAVASEPTLNAEPITVAQEGAIGNTTLHPGTSPNMGYYDTRANPEGTRQTNSTYNPNNALVNRTGQPNGAIIGTRPEPVIRTREQQSGSGSQASYQAPGAPGPFVARPIAAGGADAMTMADGGTATGGTALPVSSSVASNVGGILNDPRRLRDIQRFEPNSITEARAKLDEANAALQKQQYNQASQLAEEAQRVILAAEARAAKRAATQNLNDASNRINLASSAGSIMFAPGQLTEAIRYYEQADRFMKQGDFVKARDASEQAVVASDDARLYNVNKARDLAALSTRYNGWQASHPFLVSAEQNAAVAENLLSDSATAIEGQELAKSAVICAQMALDHARDWTYQERIDNIYKALNQALRAGANYFNVVEVKALIAEISAVRDEYTTRNFDSIELKLNTIEARLARIIETTPLVLQSNLDELTSKLNALVEAGAQEYQAQEVDDVKTLMNRSVIDFGKKDFESSYINLKKAIEICDGIENRLQEQVYYDSVTELFAQLDKAFKDFDQVLANRPQFVKFLVQTPRGRPAAISYSGKTTPNQFKDRITDIYLRTINLKPPVHLEATHNEVILAIKYAKMSAENFQKLYIIDQVNQPDANDIIDTGYAQYQKARELRSDIQVRMIEPEARTKQIRAEKIINF